MDILVLNILIVLSPKVLVLIMLFIVAIADVYIFGSMVAFAF